MQITKTLQHLNLPKRTVQLTSEKAALVRQAIKDRNFTAAGRLSAEVLSSSRLQNWRYYPFDDFMSDISDVYDTNFEALLTEWVIQNPTDAIPVLFRAQYYCDMGWWTRGQHFTAHTQPKHMSAFADYIKKCYAEADRAEQLDGSIPYGYHMKLRALRGFGMSENIRIVFQDAISKYPGYYPLYDTFLQALQPKWGGSIESMHTFVDIYAGQAGNDSPLKLLCLSLDRYLLDAASMACYPQNHNDSERLTSCVTTLMGRYTTPKSEEQLLVALQLYDRTDKYQFGVVLRPILFDIFQTTGGAAHAGAILELATTNMQSDTRLAKEDDRPANYIIDIAVSESWYLKGFYDNALTKMQEALKDASATQFPSDEERFLALGTIYQYVAGIYNKQHRIVDMIAYERAAIAVGNITGNEHFICSGYYEFEAV